MRSNEPNAHASKNAVPPGRHPLRALVIGAGATTDVIHLPILARLRDQGRITLARICDIHLPRAKAAQAKFLFLDCSSDAAEALNAADIDIVYIFGSAQMHFEYGRMALEGGNHLFVEKPIAPSFAQAQDLAKSAADRQLIAVGGHNRRFFHAFDVVRQHAGKAGWQFAEAVFHKAEAGRPPPFGTRTWLGANGIHALDALVYMMDGLPTHLNAHATQTARGEARAFAATMQWSNGAQGLFSCNNDAGARREAYVFQRQGETYTVADGQLTVEKKSSKTQSTLSVDSFEAEHIGFLDAVRSGEKPRHSIANLAPSLFLAELIEASFSGAVELPATEPNSPMRPRRAGGNSILIAEPGGLEIAFADLISRYQLISLSEVLGSSRTRPEIVGAILGRGSNALTPDLLDKLPNLAVVGVAGLSLARHEPEALLARGLALVNASEAYAESVAEFALGLAILGRRKAFMSDTVMRNGGWGTKLPPSGAAALLLKAANASRPLVKKIGLDRYVGRAWQKTRAHIQSPASFAPGARDLNNSLVGLIGWGANARAFSRRLLSAGAHVAVYSEHASDDDIRGSGAVRVSLAEALDADIVSLHRGLGIDTHHFLGAAELDRLRPGCLLINIARGALIEPIALLARLRRGDIFACLDTYETEPPAAADPLRALPNVFLTSHIAGGSPDMHAAAAVEVVQKVTAFLSGASEEAISSARLRTMT